MESENSGCGDVLQVDVLVKERVQNSSIEAFSF